MRVQKRNRGQGQGEHKSSNYIWENLFWRKIVCPPKIIVFESKRFKTLAWTNRFTIEFCVNATETFLWGCNSSFEEHPPKKTCSNHNKHAVVKRKECLKDALFIICCGKVLQKEIVQQKCIDELLKLNELIVKNWIIYSRPNF